MEEGQEAKKARKRERCCKDPEEREKMERIGESEEKKGWKEQGRDTVRVLREGV